MPIKMYKFFSHLTVSLIFMVAFAHFRLLLVSCGVCVFLFLAIFLAKCSLAVNMTLHSYVCISVLLFYGSCHFKAFESSIFFLTSIVIYSSNRFTIHWATYVRFVISVRFATLYAVALHESNFSV